MTYTFMKYWVEGTKESVHQLYEAIEKADGRAEKAIKNLSLRANEYDTFRVEWHNAKVEDKDGYSVLYFEEECPYERGTLIDQLIGEEMFKGKLTALFYYAEEGAIANLYETNDAEGKYWPNRLVIYVGKDDDDIWFYVKDEDDAVRQLHERCHIPEELNTLETIRQYVVQKLGEERFWVTPIDVVTIEKAHNRFSVKDFDYNIDFENKKATATLKEESKWKIEKRLQTH